MIRKLFLLALSAALIGSLSGPAISQTSSKPRQVIPPHIAKECAARIMEDNYRYKIVGAFFPVTPSGLFQNYARKTLAIVAPVILGPSKVHAGCWYDVGDGEPVYSQIIRPSQLPRSMEGKFGHTP